MAQVYCPACAPAAGWSPLEQHADLQPLTPIAKPASAAIKVAVIHFVVFIFAMFIDS
jgi:hypothetical protein